LFEIDQDKLLDEILDMVMDKRPANTVTVNELAERAKAEGETIARETLRTRLDKLAQDGKIERIPIGRNVYYRLNDAESHKKL